MANEMKHSGLDPQEEFVHQDYPRNPETPWKENWGFMGIDQENDVTLMFHVTLERERKRARFSRTHNIAGNKYRKRNFLDIDENFSALECDGMKIEFVRPFEEIRITDVSDDYQLDVTLTGRFDVHDFAAHRKNRAATGKNPAMNIRHYEQALCLKGSYVKDGKTLDFDGFGYRDHSWGYRNEVLMDGWNWIWVHLPNSVMHVSQMRLGDRNLTSGYMASAEGVTRLKGFETNYVERDENGAPTASQHVTKDLDGNSYTLTTKCISPVHMPWPYPEASIGPNGKQTMLFENVSLITLEETGETGVGTDEHGVMVEPGSVPSK